MEDKAGTNHPIDRGRAHTSKHHIENAEGSTPTSIRSKFQDLQSKSWSCERFQRPHIRSVPGSSVPRHYLLMRTFLYINRSKYAYTLCSMIISKAQIRTCAKRGLENVTMPWIRWHYVHTDYLGFSGWRLYRWEIEFGGRRCLSPSPVSRVQSLGSTL